MYKIDHLRLGHTLGFDKKAKMQLVYVLGKNDLLITASLSLPVVF